jgi:hypothetical protein
MTDTKIEEVTVYRVKGRDYSRRNEAELALAWARIEDASNEFQRFRDKMVPPTLNFSNAANIRLLGKETSDLFEALRGFLEKLKRKGGPK